jgi:hypothetical protein
MFALAAAGRASAQNSPPLTQAECQTAATDLSTRAPGWKWERIATCGAFGAQSLASALAGARLVTDSAFLTDLYRSASGVRDAGLLQTTMQVAEDNTAGTPARVTALLIALSQYQRFLRPFGLTFTQLVNTPLDASCMIKAPTGQINYDSDLGVTLADRQAASNRAAALAVSPSANAVVRAFARCVSRYVSFDAPPPVDPQLIAVEYVCGTKFRVRNNSTRLVDVAYQMFHGVERGELSVPARGEAFIITHCVCGFDFLYQGQVIRQVFIGTTVCPS